MGWFIQLILHEFDKRAGKPLCGEPLGAEWLGIVRAFLGYAGCGCFSGAVFAIANLKAKAANVWSPRHIYESQIGTGDTYISNARSAAYL
jgi:hypothetical protein